MPCGKSPEKNSQQGWLPRSQLQEVNWPHAVEGKKPMGRYSASITIKETKIKTRLRYDLTRLRRAILKRFSKSKRCGRRGEQGTLLHRGRGCKWVGAAKRENVWRLLKTQNGELPLFKQPHSLLLSGKRPNSKGHVHPYFQGSTSRNSQDRALTEISIDKWRLTGPSVHWNTLTNKKKREREREREQQGWTKRLSS